jgi:hypothetical protein
MIGGKIPFIEGVVCPGGTSLESPVLFGGHGSDDFASTIYGAGSTISLSLTGTTNTVVAPSAWGL